MAATVAAYLLVIIYFASDKRFRTDKNARQLTLDETDRKSTYYLLLAYGISILFLLLALLFNYFRLGLLEVGWFFGWIGVVLMALGISLRAWATRVLGRFYTRTLLTTPDHRVVQEGPYKLVRHPGYSGSLLVWIGAVVATTNWIVLAVVTVVCCAAYLYRIQSEEVMLMASFGTEYEEYRRRTRRLIPFIY